MQQPAQRSVPPTFEFAPKSFVELLQASVQIWGACWRKLFLAVFSLLLPFELAAAGLLKWLAPDLDKTLDSWSRAFAKDTRARPKFSVSEYGGILGSFGVSLLSGVLLVALVSPLVANAYLRRNTSRAELIFTTLKRGPAMLLNYLFGVVFASLPIGVALIALYFSGSNDKTKNWIPAAILGAALLSVWLFIRVLSANSSVVLEHLGPIRALRRSFGLLRGHTWRVMVSRLMASFLTLIPALTLSGLASSIFSSAGGSNPAFEFVWLGIGSAIAGALVTPIASIFGVLLYLDVRVRKEGLAIDSFATTVDFSSRALEPAQ